MKANVLNTNLSGKVAVITGAGGVLCSHFAKVLARAGAKVALLDLNLEAAEGFAKEITDEGGVARAYGCNVLDKAIHMAVEDLFSATNFIIENADQLDVDPSNIVISGSSAGAISVMQAEYEIANRTSWASVLPEGFNYAGVMSFSGAILSREGKVDYATAPCPTLMLHGTSDKLVPYKQIKLFNLGFFGGGKLVERFKKFGYSYNMFHFIDYGHEIAGSMYSTLDIQKKFLECNVMQKKMRIIEAWISDPDVWKGSGPQSRKELYGN